MLHGPIQEVYIPESSQIVSPGKTSRTNTISNELFWNFLNFFQILNRLRAELKFYDVFLTSFHKYYVLLRFDFRKKSQKRPTLAIN